MRFSRLLIDPKNRLKIKLKNEGNNIHGLYSAPNFE